MPLRTEVVNAFAALGLDTDADRQTARETYKKLALLHHPDKSKDPDAKDRFQKIGHAWEVVDKYFTNPAWGENAFYRGGDDDDDGDYMDDDNEDEDIMAYFMFLFRETVRERFAQSGGRNYRYQRRHPSMFGVPPGFVFRGSPRGAGSGSPFSHYEPPSSREYNPYSHSRDYSPQTNEQAKENQEYEQRLRELEEEVKREKAEEARKERERKATAQDRANARDRAFGAARRGDLAELQHLMDTHELSASSASGKNKGETLLLAGARSGSTALCEFLVSRGAAPGGTDKDGLNALHVAASLGHAELATHLLQKHPKDFHASKALPDGRTPLLLAVRSGAADVVRALVRFAPTHDVARCWTEVEAALVQVEAEGGKKRWRDILDVLRTKKGFVPPGEEPEKEDVAPSTPTADDEPAFGAGQSKKAVKRRRQREREAAEAAEAEKRKAAEREATLTTQRARTAESIKRQQEQTDALLREEQALIEQEERALAEATRLSLEQVKLEEETRRAREVAERQAREESERQARETAQLQAREAAQRQSREAADFQARQDAQRRAQEEAQRRAEQAERDRVAYEQAERQRAEHQQAELQTQEERRRQEAEWSRRAEAERAREAAAQARLDALRREEEAVRARARAQEVELARLRAEADTLRGPPAPPLSPPATPETPRNGPSVLSGARHSTYEAYQTVAEADYLFDPPGMQRPAPTFTPEDTAPSVEESQHRHHYSDRGRGRGYYRGRGRGRGRGGYNKCEPRPYENDDVSSGPSDPQGNSAPPEGADAATGETQADGDQPAYYTRGRGYYRGRGRGRGGYYRKSYSHYQEPVADGEGVEAGTPAPVTNGDDQGPATDKLDGHHIGHRGRGRGRGYHHGRGRGYYRNYDSGSHDGAESVTPPPVEGGDASADGETGEGHTRGRGRGRGYYRGRGRGYYKNYAHREDGPDTSHGEPAPFTQDGSADTASHTGAVLDGDLNAKPSGFRGRGRGRGRGYYHRGRGRGASTNGDAAPVVDTQ